MRSIKIDTWKAKISEDQELDENLLIAFNMLIGNKQPNELPRGLDKFRLFARLSKAFEKAEKSGVLELEEVDYEFLKKMIEADVPSTWGMNKNLTEALEEFLNAPQK